MKNFKEMPLPEELQTALEKMGFINATDVQEKAIPLMMEGKDVMVCSQTGSGKTAAYSIPLINRVMESPKRSALILAPTRELAQQIAQVLQELTKYMDSVRITLLVGGSDIRKQFKALQKKPKIIVATPGRLNDHLKRNTVQLNTTEVLVLDEGDRMIDMGFAPQLKEILKYLPEERQTSFFTATLTDKVRSLASQYLKKPEKITIGEASIPVQSIKQSVIQVELKEKDDRLVDELNKRQGSVIVFVKTKYRTDRIAKHLTDYGFAVDLIHGDRTQGQRNKAIKNFKNGESRILCATDVAARGIDVPQVEHVINFDIPTVDEDYVHRIGRTARNGAEGEAVTFVSSNEHRTWQILAQKYKIKGVELVGGSSKRKDRSFKDKEGRGGDRKKRSSFSGRGRRSEFEAILEDRPKSFSKKRSERSERSFDDSRGSSKPFSKKRGERSEKSFDDSKSFSKKKKDDFGFFSKDKKGKAKSFSKKSRRDEDFFSEDRKGQDFPRRRKKDSESFGEKREGARSFSRKKNGESSFKKSSKKAGKSFGSKKSGGKKFGGSKKKKFSRQNAGF